MSRWVDSLTIQRRMKVQDMSICHKVLAGLMAGAVLLTGASMATPAMASEDEQTIKVTPNPWYADGPFQGWGTSLAWFANATGNYGEPGSISQSSGDPQTDAKALAYGRQLRENFYTSIFGKEGLGLNKARYNIGGGNASDVAYGYPFMRQGAAMPGYWAQDPDGSLGLYGGLATTMANKAGIDRAFDPHSDASYVWGSASSDSPQARDVKAQEWWLKRGAQNHDIDHVEAAANAAPWFMTESGYVSGGDSGNANNLADAEKFAQYLAAVTRHLSQLKADNGNRVGINTVEPLNESETGYWSSPRGRASDAWPAEDRALIDRYWNRYYQGKNKAVTPYTTEVKKPQEGMHVDTGTAGNVIRALRSALDAEGLQQTLVSATDATDSGQFVDSYHRYPQDVRDAIGQYNTHGYGTNRQRAARDIAQGDGKALSMSEVDGSWQSGGFNPYGFDNALGMAGKINADVYALQSRDYTFWQIGEDLYNVATGDKDMNGNSANPKGEDTNWGTVFLDYDCSVAGVDGKLYSRREVDNNGGQTSGIRPCRIVVNAKYNAVRAYTKFIHPGDFITANNATKDNMTASSADGKTQTVIHRNGSDQPQTLVIDLSNYGSIDSDASGKLFLTTEPDHQQDIYTADMSYMNKYSNKEQPHGVTIDAAAKTATVKLPARSIASIQLTGVSGVSPQAQVKDGSTIQLQGQQSGKMLTASSDGLLMLEGMAKNPDQGRSQAFTVHSVESSAGSPKLPRYLISSADGSRFLCADGRMRAGTRASIGTDARFIWMLNTENGKTFSLVNQADKVALDVTGQRTDAGATISVAESTGADNQGWYFRSTEPTGAEKTTVQVPLGGSVAMPQTVIPYYSWGQGEPVPVVWKTEAVDVGREGTYQVQGVATDFFGNTFPCQASVFVGDLTVTDPASATILFGSDAQEARKAMESTTVYAHVKASPAIKVDPHAVSWDWADLQGKLDRAHEGDVVPVKGNLAISGGRSLPLSFSLYLEAAKPQNVADVSYNLTVTDQDVEYGKEDQWRKLTDGNMREEAWATWNSAGNYRHSPTANLDFGQVRQLDRVAITYKDHPPVSAKAEYTNDGANWKPLGKVVNNPQPGQTVTFQAAGMVGASKVRIVNTVDNAWMDAAEIEAWARPWVGPVRNLAWGAGTHFSVNVQDGDTAGKAIDGHVASGWSTQSASSDVDPTATFNFDKIRTISQVKTVFHWDGRASWPKSQTLEYCDQSDNWHRLETKTGWYLPQAGGTDTSTEADAPTVTFTLASPVQAKAVRLINSLQDTKTYINVAEIELNGTESLSAFEPEPGNDSNLADLRLDGRTITDFSPDRNDYVVDLPAGSESNPVLQAFSRDNAAKVVQTDERMTIGGKSLITVTSADGSRSRVYSVRYRSFDLQGLQVVPPTKTRYAIGERFDPSGLAVSAVYISKDRDRTEVRPLALDDPELSVTGFDSTVAGKKTIVVAYRGVNASFGIWVKATGRNASGTGAVGLNGNDSPLGGPSHAVLAHSGASIISVALLVGALALTSFAALLGRRYLSSRR